MVSPAIDHLPLPMLMGADVSLTIEQRFPLSGTLGHRRRGAEAEALRQSAEATRTGLDVELEATNAFLMLHEQRGMLGILEQQAKLAQQLTAAANARYRSGSGAQADVLRSEIEVARLGAMAKATGAEARAAEAMLNTALARDVGAPVPALAYSPPEEIEDGGTLVADAVSSRPEVAVGKAEVARAEAGIDEMKSMYWPMAMVRVGPAYTMAEGPGAMVMLGVSIPIWRSRLRAGVDEAEAMARMARADLDAMSRMVQGEAAEAFARLDAARTRHKALRDDVLPRARLAIAPSLAAYAAGQVPLVSVVEAFRTLWSTEAELLSAEVNVGIAWARYARTLGRTNGVSNANR